MTTSSHHIDFEPIGRRGDVPAGHSLLDAARQLGIDLVNLCGGAGTCGRCRVQVLDGPVSPPSEAEHNFLDEAELADGWRLACKAIPRGDVRIHVPASSLTAVQRTQVEGQETRVALEPAVVGHLLQLEPPSWQDLRADVERGLDALETPITQLDTRLLQSASPQLREWGWRFKAYLRGDEWIAVGPPESRALGLAVDMGTTKLAGYLVDLESGQTLAAEGAMNPQIGFGEDLMARITYATDPEHPEGGEKLQSVLIAGLNDLIAQLKTAAGQESSQIVDGVMVGNTAIHHLSLGLPVAQLGVSPFVPAVSRALNVKARDIGLALAPGAYVHLLPNVAGFVGADHVAMLLATGVPDMDEVTLALDVGTNTEVALNAHGQLSSVSCASGPAFEGASIKYGMRAAKGAIERLRLVDGRLEFQTIEGAPPVGLCGSGILDSVAQLYLDGVVDASGRMSEEHPRVQGTGAKREFVIASAEQSKFKTPITLTQNDVRQIQLAKGAIRAGIKVLLEDAGLAPGDLDRIIIAGAFGTYIDVTNAIAIDMLPDVPLERFEQVGNAAGMGAKMALLSVTQRERARQIAARDRYIELTNTPDFMMVFANSMNLGAK